METEQYIKLINSRSWQRESHLLTLLTSITTRRPSNTSGSDALYFFISKDEKV